MPHAGDIGGRWVTSGAPWVSPGPRQPALSPTCRLRQVPPHTTRAGRFVSWMESHLHSPQLFHQTSMYRPHRKLPQYLRRERKRAGLTARELAQLLGWKDETTVSRYEHFKRLPTIPVLLAYEVIFGLPVAQLVGGLMEDVETEVLQRARDLLPELKARPSKSRLRAALLARLDAMVKALDTP